MYYYEVVKLLPIMLGKAHQESLLGQFGNIQNMKV
jgi:hypothetical protein